MRNLVLAVKPLPCDGDALIRRCVEDCHQGRHDDARRPIMTANQVDMPYAYVVYDHARSRTLKSSKNGFQSGISSWRAVTASGNITTPTMRLLPAKKRRRWSSR